MQARSPRITDIWFQSAMLLEELASVIGLTEQEFDVEDNWAWVVGYFRGIAVDVARLQSQPPQTRSGSGARRRDWNALRFASPLTTCKIASRNGFLTDNDARCFLPIFKRTISAPLNLLGLQLSCAQA